MFEKYNNILKSLDSIELNFNEPGLFLMNIAIAFIMFGVALNLKTDHFKNVLKSPKAVAVGIFSQFLFLPGITFLIILLLDLPVSISLGMLLVASCPGGNISNFITSLARGNVALSVSLTAISDISSVVMTPLNFTFWGNLYLSTLPLVHPIEIPLEQVVITIVMLMGIPLTLGILFNYRFPKTTERILKPIKILSIVLFIGFVLGAIIANIDSFLNYAYLIIPIVILHNFIAFSLGFSVASLFKLSKQNVKTITIETGIQNSGIALVLIFNHNIFPAGYGGIAFITALWGIWHIISGLGLSYFWSLNTERVRG